MDGVNVVIMFGKGLEIKNFIQNMKVKLRVENQMGVVFETCRKEGSMLENWKMGEGMVKEHKLGKMEESLLENGGMF